MSVSEDWSRTLRFKSCGTLEANKSLRIKAHFVRHKKTRMSRICHFPVYSLLPSAIAKFNSSIWMAKFHNLTKESPDFHVLCWHFMESSTGTTSPGTSPKEFCAQNIRIYWWSLAQRTSWCPQLKPGHFWPWLWPGGTLSVVTFVPWGT